MIDRIRRSFASAERCHHGGRIREAMARAAGGDILDFSANINPLGSPPLEDLVKNELRKIGHYPDNTYREFREEASEFVGTEPENIVPGNGSSEIIRLFAEMALYEGAVCLVPSPTFGEYESQSRLAGARIIKTDLGLPSKRSMDDVFEDRLLDVANAAFFCNPNNPTGVLTDRRDVERLARRSSDHQTFLLVDEAFIELADPSQSVAGLAPEMDNLVVMRSLTKSFGVPGLRLGFAVTNSDLAEVMDRARIPWSIGSIASAAAVRLLRETAFLEESRRVVREELAWLRGTLRGMGFEPIESSVNFILVNVGSSGLSSTELSEITATRGVLIRDCVSFGLGSDYIRVAVRTRRENECLIAALGEAIVDVRRRRAA